MKTTSVGRCGLSEVPRMDAGLVLCFLVFGDNNIRGDGKISDPCMPFLTLVYIQALFSGCTLPFAKFSRRDRYCGYVLAAMEVLVQGFW